MLFAAGTRMASEYESSGMAKTKVLAEDLLPNSTVFSKSIFCLFSESGGTTHEAHERAVKTPHESTVITSHLFS